MSGREYESPSVPDEILDHYQQRYDEDARLGTGHGLLELERTRDVLSRFLPPAPAAVLDVGGATGVHAFWLADRGYEVRLFDPVPGHVERARRTSEARDAGPRVEAASGDARKLPVEDGSADAVLLFGPLYHLTDRDDRLLVLREAARCLRPGGVVVAAAISRFASLFDGVARDLLADQVFRDIVSADLETGQHRNPTDDPEYFTTAFFHHPEELREEMLESGLSHETTIGVEGAFCLLPDLEERMRDADRRERLLWAARRVETEASMLGSSAHLLAVARVG